MKRHTILAATAIGLYLSASLNAEQEKPSKPNIIFILADDLGYGDLSDAGGKAATPHCDRLASEGMRFTDAHTSSAVCTPTRYGILTGRYNWRSEKKRGVLGGFSKPLIPQDRVTIANFLKAQGYHTGMVGKWHLGIGWQKLPDGKTIKPVKSHIKEDYKGKKRGSWDIDYSKPAITPIHNGFDYFFGIAASLDMPPYVYIRNDKAIAPADHEKAFATPYRPGPASADFEADQCLIDFARESREYIARRSQSQEKKPFFLYVPLTSPHTPILPSKKWQGKSHLGEYGDFLMETDWVVGEILAELKKQGQDENTMVIFTADNGCSPMAQIPELAEKEHKVNADWRGHKADIYEGGHRVPFLVRWPAGIRPGTADSTICTTDFFATAADAASAGNAIKENQAEDSFSFFPELTGTGKTKRETTVHHSINGSFAIRKGKWKLCLCPGSGGWSSPKPGPATANLPLVQLYDLTSDPAEQNNLQADKPEIVKQLIDQLAKEIKQGRSTPGSPQTNEGSIPFPKKLLEKFPQLQN